MYLITTIRTVPAPAGDHEHLDVVGYLSDHIENEPITIETDRVAARIAMGEEFGVQLDEDVVPVKVAKCPICKDDGHLKTSKDSKSKQLLLGLPHFQD